MSETAFIERPAGEALLGSEDVAAPLDCGDLFGLSEEEACGAVLEVEIGCGNGRYIRRAAAERPGHLFVGIERNVSYARKARDRMVKYGVGNARIVHADATRFLESHFVDGSIDALHVYFTDPWPKRRHAKRRLFQRGFLDLLGRVLAPGAPVYVKVDLFWYFEEIYGRFERHPFYVVEACGMDADRERDLYEITGFEQKALAQKGRTFHLRARSCFSA